MNWLVWKNGKRFGPIAEADLGALIQSGELHGAQPVCREGSATWTPLDQVPELARFLPAASADGSAEVVQGLAQRAASSSPVRETSSIATSAADAATGNWMTRHWRGDVPLARSYWVNGALVSVLLALPATLIAFFVDFPSSPRLSAGAMIAFWLFCVSVIAWQVVGVWRSAGRHASRGGARGWAIAARVAAIAGCLQVGALLAIYVVPQLREYAMMIADRDPIGDYRIRLLRGASEMEISGDIAFGLTDQVTLTLNAHPSVSLIHLNSRGGRVAEARKLRDLIASRHLSTYTSRQCTSACVIAFLAGERRLISADAKIGFHQYSIAGKSGALTTADMEKDERYFLSRGVSAVFVKRAFKPISDFWYPTPEQMLAAHYITGYAGSEEVALSGMLPAEIDRMEETLRQEPLYATMAELEPDAYGQIAAAAKNSFRRGESMIDLRLRTLPIVRQVYTRRLPFASDDAIVAFAELMKDQIELLRPHPDLCVEFLSPDGVGADISALFPKDIARREQQVMSEVIRSAATGAWQPPGEDELRPILAEVSARLLNRWSPDDLAHLTDPDRAAVDTTRACAVYADYYRFIVDLPPAKAGAMLRHAFATPR